MLRLFFVILLPIFCFCDTLTITEASADLAITTATAGLQPDPDIDSNYSYTLTYDPNSGARSMRARIDTALPTDMNLYITVEAPDSGTAIARVLLSTTNADVVTGLDTSIDPIGSFGITLEAESDGAEAQFFSRTLTLETYTP